VAVQVREAAAKEDETVVARVVEATGAVPRVGAVRAVADTAKVMATAVRVVEALEEAGRAGREAGWPGAAAKVEEGVELEEVVAKARAAAAAVEVAG